MAVSQRIVSLLPSGTEILCALGLESRLVGLSHACDYPPPVMHLPRLTLQAPRTLEDEPQPAGLSAYALDLVRLRVLQPDLIVTQAQAAPYGVSTTELLEATRRALGSHVDVLSLQPTLLQDIWDDIYRVGAATGQRRQATTLLEELFARVNTIVAETIMLRTPRRVAILTDIAPLRLAGDWFPDLVQLAGGAYRLQTAGAPAASIAWEPLQVYAPEVLILSPCGTTLQQAQTMLLRLRELPGWDALPAVRQSQVYAVDGQTGLHRPGPRIVESLELLAGLIHPDIFGEFLTSAEPFYCQVDL